MHTERIGDDRGKVISTRVLEATPELVKTETSFREKGSLLGIEYETFGTYVSLISPDGSEYGETKAVMTTRDDELITYHAAGRGVSGGKGYEGRFQATVYFSSKSESPEIKRLCKAPVLAEFESDEEGNTTTTYYEWQM